MGYKLYTHHSSYRQRYDTWSVCVRVERVQRASQRHNTENAQRATGLWYIWTRGCPIPTTINKFKYLKVYTYICVCESADYMTCFAVAICTYFSQKMWRGAMEMVSQWKNARKCLKHYTKAIRNIAKTDRFNLINIMRFVCLKCETACLRINYNEILI